MGGINAISGSARYRCFSSSFKLSLAPVEDVPEEDKDEDRWFKLREGEEGGGGGNDDDYGGDDAMTNSGSKGEGEDVNT